MTLPYHKNYYSRDITHYYLITFKDMFYPEIFSYNHSQSLPIDDADVECIVKLTEHDAGKLALRSTEDYDPPSEFTIKELPDNTNFEINHRVIKECIKFGVDLIYKVSYDGLDFHVDDSRKFLDLIQHWDITPVILDEDLAVQTVGKVFTGTGYYIKIFNHDIDEVTHTGIIQNNPYESILLKNKDLELFDPDCRCEEPRCKSKITDRVHIEELLNYHGPELHADVINNFLHPDIGGLEEYLAGDVCKFPLMDMGRDKALIHNLDLQAYEEVTDLDDLDEMKLIIMCYGTDGIFYIVNAKSKVPDDGFYYLDSYKLWIKVIVKSVNPLPPGWNRKNTGFTKKFLSNEFRKHNKCYKYTIGENLEAEIISHENLCKKYGWKIYERKSHEMCIDNEITRLGKEFEGKWKILRFEFEDLGYGGICCVVTSEMLKDWKLWQGGSYWSTKHNALIRLDQIDEGLGKSDLIVNKYLVDECLEKV